MSCHVHGLVSGTERELYHLNKCSKWFPRLIDECGCYTTSVHTEKIVFQIKVVSFTTDLSICPLTLHRTDETQTMSHEQWACVFVCTRTCVRVCDRLSNTATLPVGRAPGPDMCLQDQVADSQHMPTTWPCAWRAHSGPAMRATRASKVSGSDGRMRHQMAVLMFLAWHHRSRAVSSLLWLCVFLFRSVGSFVV